MSGQTKKRVFISYAHADNLPMEESQPGWVSYFVDKLKRTVARQAGGASIEFWMDHQLEPQRRVNDELRKRIRESTVILSLISPRYMESKWCQLEIATFVEEVGGGVSDDRVFMVELLPTARQAWHKQVQDLSPVKFWRDDLTNPEPQTLGWPMPDVRGDRDYWSQVNTLASRLARQLRALAAEESAPLAPAAQPAAASSISPSAPPAALPITLPTTYPAAGPLSIVISTESSDAPLALDAQNLLGDLDADATIDTPPAENDPVAAYRANFESQLRGSHGVIVVYGAAPRSWVQSKFGEVKKVLALERKGIWAGLIEGPPEPKPLHGLPPRGLMVLNCKQGISKEELSRFVQVLRGGPNHV